MARYGQKVKDAVVARLLPPESASLEAVSQKVGISVATLERWRAAALAANDGNSSSRQWTPAARLEAVIGFCQLSRQLGPGLVAGSATDRLRVG
jgi:transposase